MNKHSTLLDKLIKFACVLLFLFIPLYPKLPLLDIASTWVYIRLEDVVVAGVVGLYIARWRLPKDNPLGKPILIYWLVGFVSTLISITIVGRVIWHYFPHLTILHYLRRIEYMIVFFVAASTIRTTRDIVHYLGVFTLTTVLVNIYAYGQKFLGYPAFLTLNEEFAKGEPLILGQASRITSTFGGHYDLAAYLVFAIVLFVSLMLGIRNLLVRALLLVASLTSGIVLLWTQSRNSLLSLGIALLSVLWWHKKKALFIPIVVVATLAIPFVLASSDRYAKTLQYRRVLYDKRAGSPLGAAHVSPDGRVIIEEFVPGVESLPIGSGFIRIPLDPPIPVTASYAVTALRESKDYPTDEIPTIGEEAQMAFERNELKFSTAGPVATTSGEVQILPNRFLLDRALTYDISITTRFGGTWPRAWEAFSRNILTGSGYSVLNLASDNDYLRALGETGIIGLFTFFFIFFAYFVYMRRATSGADRLVASTAFGVGGGIVSLLVAAFFVDIFEASKMAYILWMMMGVAIGGLMLNYKKPLLILPEIFRIITHPLLFIMLLVIGGFVLFGDSGSIYFLGDDFTWLSWASSTYLSDLPKFFLDATGFFYRPLSKLYFMGAYSLFWFKPGGYHLVNVVLHVISTILVYLLVRKTVGKTFIAIASSLLFLVMAIHHENIYWISGISSLAGATSALFAVYLFLRFLRQESVWRYVFFFGSFFFMAGALLWYEGMMGMPLVIVAAAVLFGKRRQWPLSGLFILLIPLYWWLRTVANAVSPEGNYGINMYALPFNVVGNSLGYLGMSLVGPDAVDLFWNIRQWTKTNPLLGMITVALVAVVLWRRAAHRSISRQSWFWASVFLFSLVPYLGLGNIAERYGFIASSAVSVLLVLWLARYKKIVAVLGILALMGFNWWQLSQVRREWQQAGVLTENLLQTTRKLYFPLEGPTNLVFLGVPEKIGRAWVFPVGLSDAMDHVFADARLRVYTQKITAPGVTHVLVVNENYEVTQIE